MQLALATCHSLSKLNGQYIGDPLDQKMFESSKWVRLKSLIANLFFVTSRTSVWVTDTEELLWYDVHLFWSIGSLRVRGLWWANGERDACAPDSRCFKRTTKQYFWKTGHSKSTSRGGGRLAALRYSSRRSIATSARAQAIPVQLRTAAHVGARARRLRAVRVREGLSRGHRGALPAKFRCAVEVNSIQCSFESGDVNTSGDVWYLVPQNYTEHLKRYTSNGHRVIAIAFKQLDLSTTETTREQLANCERYYEYSTIVDQWDANIW